jgi:hypothetical protein
MCRGVTLYEGRSYLQLVVLPYKGSEVVMFACPGACNSPAGDDDDDDDVFKLERENAGIVEKTERGEGGFGSTGRF